jgi:hypothetical protein
MSGTLQSFEYLVKIISPEGIRVKGDDLTDKIALKLETESNKLGKDGWQIISLVPTVTSEGSVSKLLVTFQKFLK